MFASLASRRVEKHGSRWNLTIQFVVGTEKTVILKVNARFVQAVSPFCPLLPCFASNTFDFVIQESLEMKRSHWLVLFCVAAVGLASSSLLATDFQAQRISTLTISGVAANRRGACLGCRIPGW